MAKDKQPATDFSDDVEDKTSSAEELPTVEKAEDGTPYCALHHCKMKQTSGGKAGSPVAYFKCPVDGCEEKGKKVKTSKSVIPSEPHTCSRCGGVPVMSRDPKLSRATYTILRCPECGHKSAPMPRPEFVHGFDRARGALAVEPLGMR